MERRAPLSVVGGNGKVPFMNKKNSEKLQESANDKENIHSQLQSKLSVVPGFPVFRDEPEQQRQSQSQHSDTSFNESVEHSELQSDPQVNSALTKVPSYQPLIEPLDDVKVSNQVLFDLSAGSLDKSSPMAVEEDEDDDTSSAFASAVSSEGSDYFTAPPISDKELHSEQIYCVPEYVDDIYKYMRKREVLLRPSQRYLPKQLDITNQMRSILIDWLVDVAAEYDLQQETLHLAVNYVDRVLSGMVCKRGKLQLVGTTAMMIASKYEEIYPPELSEFVYITDDTYDNKQVLKMERIILECLGFKVASATSSYFANRFLKFCRSGNKTKYLTNYLCDLALVEYDFLQYLPSQIAGASVCLANLMTGPVPWPMDLEVASEITIANIYPCLTDLLKLFRSAPDSQYTAVYEKYREHKFCQVALLDAPDSLPEIS